MEDPQENLTTVFRSAGFAKEVEARVVQGMLESNGLPAFITGTEVMPGPYRFAAREICVQVPADRGDEAAQLIAEAEASGPSALEAEPQQ